MRLILLGCPGAGKGTQAKLIASELHVPAISTGEIFRAAIKQQTPLGKQIKNLVDNGQLVSDELVNELVKERLQQQDCRDGYLLDGYPRTINQALALQSYDNVDYIIDIDVPEDEIVKRLSGRRVHTASGRVYHTIYNPPKIADVDDETGEALIQRVDDLEATVRKRLAIYNEQTKPLVDFYHNYQAAMNEKAPQYVKINGSQSVDKIHHDLMTLLGDAV